MNITKKLFFTLLILSAFSSSYAQKDTLFGKNYVSIGVGFPNLSRNVVNALLQNKEKFTSSGTGPYHLKYENRVLKWLGIGASINHMTYKITYIENVLDTSVGIIKPNKIEVSSNNTALNLRFNFHFINPEKNDKVDFYFGFGGGYKFGKMMVISQYPEYAPKLELPDINKFGFEVSLGFRYFFDKNIGFYTEVGLAKSIVQVGVTARF